MTVILDKKENKKFKEKLEYALENDLITKIQRDAMLAKYMRKRDGEKLSVQNRNALRMLRNSLIHNQDTILNFSKNIIRYELLQDLLSMADDIKGMYCHICKEGFLAQRIISSWIHAEKYELILEQKPAQICINNSCKTTSVDIETEEKEEEIITAVEKQLRSIRSTEPEELSNNKCPQCKSKSMKPGQKGETYRYRQGLYHIKIKEVPLKGYCTVCHYQEIGENVARELEILENLLDEKVLELVKAKY